MRDPYAILGISPTASDEEVKAAYRRLARRYHPDNYNGDPAATRHAEEKMKEINEAYDTVVKLRSQHTGGQNSQNGPADYAEIRRRINHGMFADAELMLGRIPPADRGAEWHYLKSVVLMRRGWLNDALTEIEIACNLDPANDEYRRAREAFVRNAAAYGRGYGQPYGRRPAGMGGECSTCDMCSGLILTDCCCECLGGDFIRCL